MDFLSNIFVKPPKRNDSDVVEFHSVSAVSGEPQEIIVFDASFEELSKRVVDQKEIENLEGISISSEDFVEDTLPPVNPVETLSGNLKGSDVSNDTSKGYENFVKEFGQDSVDEIEQKVLEKVPYYSPFCCFHLKPRRNGDASIKRALFEKFFNFQPAVTKEEIRLYTLVKMKNASSGTNIQEKLVKLVDISSEQVYRSPFCWFSLTNRDLEKSFWRKVKIFLRFKPVNINKVFFILDCEEVEDWVDKTVDSVQEEKNILFNV